MMEARGGKKYGLEIWEMVSRMELMYKKETGLGLMYKKETGLEWM